MTISVPTPLSISFLLVISLMIAYMIVSHNPPGLSVTINEYFIGVGHIKEPSLNFTISNQTKFLNKRQGAYEQDQDPVDDDELSSGPEMRSGLASAPTVSDDEMQEVEKANNAVVDMANNSVVVSASNNDSTSKDFEVNGVNSSNLIVPDSSPALSVDEMPPTLFDDELQREEKGKSSVNVTGEDITESNRLVSHDLADDPGVNITQTAGQNVTSLDLPVPVAGFSSPSSKVDAKSELRSCNLYRGKWIYDPAGPLYTNNTCPILTQSQNCQGNGRPDKGYENWRWKPNQCDLPRFDARKFLELMRGKTLAFVGDSLARNQMESLLCILWQAEVPIKGGNRQIHRWYFKSTSTTIARIWSAWLVHNTPLSVPSSSPRAVNVHIDNPDEFIIDFLPKFDIVVLSSGHWFSRESTYILNGTVVNRPMKRTRRTRKRQFDIVKFYGTAMQTILNSIANLPNYNGLTLFRSYSPEHYEGGMWNTGGSCAGIDRPTSKSVRSGYTNAMLKKQSAEVERVAKQLRNGSKMRFMDITEVAGYRHDGHPGPYSSPSLNAQSRRKGPEDCVHWCMPGPVDTWNEILFEIIKTEA